MNMKLIVDKIILLQNYDVLLAMFLISIIYIYYNFIKR